MADFKTSLEQYTQAPQSSPSATVSESNSNSNNSERVTQQEILRKLKGFSSHPHVRETINKITNLDLSGINQHDRTQMEIMFGYMHSLTAEELNTPYELQAYIDQAEGLYQVYQERIKQTGEDSKIAQGKIISNRFLDDNDELDTVFIAIETRLNWADKMSEKELLEAIDDIKLSGTIKGEDAWDGFFLDLFDDLWYWEYDDFMKEVNEFKTSNPNLYKSEIDTSDVETSFDGQINQLMSGELDPQLAEGLKIKVPLDGILSSISNGNFGEDFEVGPFHTREGALKMIYKLKLMFQQLENNGGSIVGAPFRAMFDVTWGATTTGVKYGAGETWEQLKDTGEDIIGLEPLDAFGNLVHAGIVGFLTMIIGTIGYLAPVGATIYVAGAPMESGVRRIRDWLSVRFGDKGWASPLKAAGKGLRSVSQFAGKQAGEGGKNIFGNGIIKGPANLLRAGAGASVWTITKPFDFLMGISGKLLESAERAHLDASNLLAENVLLLNGIEGNTGNSSIDGGAGVDKPTEIRTRVKILALLRRNAEYEGNQEKLDAIDKIWNGNLFTNSESFYIDVKKIMEGKVGEMGRIIRPRNFAELWFILNKKENVVSEYKKQMDNIHKLLLEIYDGVTFDAKTGEVKIPEAKKFTDMMKYLNADIDFSLISNADEETRQKLIKEFISELQKGKVGNLSPDDMKLELRKIVEGYMPKFKIIQEIIKSRKRLTHDPISLANLETFRQQVLRGDWYGTKTEMDSVISGIRSAIPGNNTPSLRNLDDIKKEGEKLGKMSIRDADFNERVTENFYSKDAKISSILIDLGELPGSNSGEIQRELRKLFADAKNTTKNLDWTIPEWNYAIAKIYQGKKYNPNGDGRFGNPRVSIDDMISEYSNIDDIRERNITKMISALSTETDFNEKTKAIKSLYADIDLVNDIKHRADFKTMIHSFESTIGGEITRLEREIIALDDRANSLISSVDYDEKSGAGRAVKKTSDDIFSIVRDLKKQIAGLKASGATMKDKIDFYKNTPIVLADITSETNNLDKQVKSMKRRRGGGTTAPLRSTHDPVIKGPIIDLDAPKALDKEVKDIVGRIVLYAKLTGAPIDSITEAELFDEISANIENKTYTTLSDIETLVPAKYNLKSMDQIAKYIKTQKGIKGDFAKNLDAAATAGPDSFFRYLKNNFKWKGLGKFN